MTDPRTNPLRGKLADKSALDSRDMEEICSLANDRNMRPDIAWRTDGKSMWIEDISVLRPAWVAGPDTMRRLPDRHLDPGEIDKIRDGADAERELFVNACKAGRFVLVDADHFEDTICA